MSSSEFHEKFKSKNLRDFRLGTVASSDHETPLTFFLLESVNECHLDILRNDSMLALPRFAKEFCIKGATIVGGSSLIITFVVDIVTT